MNITEVCKRSKLWRLTTWGPLNVIRSSRMGTTPSFPVPVPGRPGCCCHSISGLCTGTVNTGGAAPPSGDRSTEDWFPRLCPFPLMPPLYTFIRWHRRKLCWVYYTYNRERSSDLLYSKTRDLLQRETKPFNIILKSTFTTPFYGIITLGLMQ